MLGGQLKQHQLFVNLLKLLKGGTVVYGTLLEAFARNMPATLREDVERVLDALLVLVAWALRDDGQPLVTLRVQLWVRELRRMVSKLSVDPQEVRLRSERDLPGMRDGVYLPMVQCSQCRTTGWLSRLVPGSSKLSTQLRRNLQHLVLPQAGGGAPVCRRECRPHAGQRHYPIRLRRLRQRAARWGHVPSLRPSGMLDVFRVTAQRTQVTDHAQYTWHDPVCPGCGEHGELLLLGARNATLGSQVVDASWASVFNDDKKLIAFSDSVQDAAHRAGFFGARTWQNNVRTAWAHALDELQVAAMPWPDFLSAAEARFDAPESVLHVAPETLVAEFLAPNMTWQHDWSEELLKHQRLPSGSRLPDKVKSGCYGSCSAI